MLSEKMDFLQQVLEGFAGSAMPVELRRQLERLAEERRIARDVTMLSVGEFPSEIFFLCRGLCRSYYLDIDGNDVTRFFILEGDFCLTEIQILAEPSELCVETLEDCQGLAFQLRDLEALPPSHFLKDAYIAALQKNIRYKIKREKSFLLTTATERYQQFRQSYPGLEGRVRQSQLASYLGVTPTSLSRIRKSLR